MELIHNAFEIFVNCGILLVELIGVAVLIYTAVRSVAHIFRRDPHVKLRLAEGISLALEFKLGSEVLRTLVVRTWNELAMLGAIVVFHAAVTILLNWSIQHERANLQI